MKRAFQGEITRTIIMPKPDYKVSTTALLPQANPERRGRQNHCTHTWLDYDWEETEGTSGKDIAILSQCS